MNFLVQYHFLFLFGKYIVNNSVIYSRSIKDIKEDEELTLDYAQTALIAEDCTDPDVINYYCGILNLSQEKFLAFVKGNKK